MKYTLATGSKILNWIGLKYDGISNGITSQTLLGADVEVFLYWYSNSYFKLCHICQMSILAGILI
jgi:hypothetical protein